MNAERLHAVAIALREELDATEAPRRVSELLAMLQQLAANPSHAPFQADASRLRGELDTLLSASPSRNFSPARWESLKELGVADLIGDNLRQRINAVLARNEITPTAAAEELAPIAEQLQSVDASVTQLISAFGAFNVGAEGLDPGEFEVGLLIPRPAVHNDLKTLGAEFVEFDRMLRPFYELATGTRPDVQVRSIGSSDFEVYVAAAPGVAVSFAYAASKIMGLYQQLLDIRRARQELRDAGVNEEALDGIDTHADTHMSLGIDAAVTELLEEFGQHLDEGRTNELRIELRISLNTLANRVDRGYNVEVRAEPPAELPEDASENDEAARETLEELSARVTALQGALSYLNLTGRSILSLPEAEPDVPADDEADLGSV